jgi:ankyrin repeat protein
LNVDGGLDSSSTIAVRQNIPPTPSKETIRSHNSESASHNYASPRKVKKLNERFSKAVKELDTPLIYNWIKDPNRRPNLNAELIRSALFDLASVKKTKHPQLRDEAVSVILDECGVDIEYMDDVYKATPLILAASFGHEAITKLLIDKGAKLQARDGICERTALSWAAKNNNIGTAKILLGALHGNLGRQILESKDVDGCTACALADKRGHKEMAELLKSHEASLNV